MNDPQQAVPVAPATDTSAFGLASVDTSEAGERVSDEAIEQASDAAEDAVEEKDDEASNRRTARWRPWLRRLRLRLPSCPTCGRRRGR